MGLYRRELRGRLYLFPVFFAVLLLLWFFCRSRTGLLILYVELIFISLPAVLCGCLYNNPDEIELTVSAPTPTYRSFAAKYFSIITMAAFPVVLFYGIVTCVYGTSFLMTGYYILSFLVTSLFFSAGTALFRLLFRNAYVTVSLFLIFLVALALNHDALKKGLRPFYFHYFDPYITDIAAGGRIWLINRLILLGASLLLLLGSFLLLKKDRLYHTDNR